MSNDPELSTAMKLSVIARLLRTRFDQRARTIGLTRAQWRTIAAVSRHPGATQHRIATLLEVGDVTAGRMIDRLNEEGWIERRPDPTDRRAYRVHLTPAADPVLRELTELGADEERRALAGLDAEEIARFSETLGRVLANLAGRCGADDLPEDTEAA